MKWISIKVILLYAFVGCSEDIGAQLNTRIVSFDEKFEISLEEKVVIKDDNKSGEVTDSLLVEMTLLEDNRCPEGANCIRAGEVQMQLIASSRQQTEALATCIGFGCGFLDEKFRNQSSHTEVDTTVFTLDGRSYELIFMDAVPSPKVDGKKSERSDGADRAILKVVR